MFVGVVGYDKDLLLLVPSRLAVQVMQRTCKELTRKSLPREPDHGSQKVLYSSVRKQPVGPGGSRVGYTDQRLADRPQDCRGCAASLHSADGAGPTSDKPAGQHTSPGGQLLPWAHGKPEL